MFWGTSQNDVFCPIFRYFSGFYSIWAPQTRFWPPKHVFWLFAIKPLYFIRFWSKPSKTRIWTPKTVFGHPKSIVRPTQISYNIWKPWRYLTRILPFNSRLWWVEGIHPASSWKAVPAQTSSRIYSQLCPTSYRRQDKTSWQVASGSQKTHPAPIS